MKKFLSLILSVVIFAAMLVPFQSMAQELTPVLEYTFDSSDENYIKKGNAAVVWDNSKGSNVLSLDGSKGTYAQLPKGFFDGRDKMTITMDVKSNMREGNFFTFTYGVDDQRYAFLKVCGYENVFTTTTESWRVSHSASSLSARPDMWQNIAIVVDDNNFYVYVNAIKQSEFISDTANNNVSPKTSDLGTNLMSYLGKSFYSADSYFNGSFDNFRVYDKALTAQEIVDAVGDSAPIVSSMVVGTVADKGLTGTDYHTASNTIIDRNSMTITPYVRKNADLSSLPIKINSFSEKCEYFIDGEKITNGCSVDLTYDRTLTASYNGRNESYTLSKAQIAGNSVLPGQYADPDIDYIDGKYWMFPTTDGAWWWGGTDFHAFSSTDLVNWKDEGVVLDLANDNPGKNINGVQIAPVKWASGNAWAPTVEAKNGKIYLYFCGRDIREGAYGDDLDGRMAIGVAYADNPAGPYTVVDEPIITSMTAEAGIEGYTSIDGIIDPAVFTDDDGTSYLLFGNTTAVIAKLSKDMLSVDVDSFTEITGIPDFLESIYVNKINGLYHFTWSCYGTNNEHYAVKYGTTKSLTPGSNGKINVDYHYTLLSKNYDLGLLCTGHQSILYQKDLGRCFIAYHRFCTPLEEYTEGYGFHRETCIDEVFFDENGLMKVVVPTMDGIDEVKTKPASDLTVTLRKYRYTYDNNIKQPSVTVTDLNGKIVDSSNYTVKYTDNLYAGIATATVTFKNNYAGVIKENFKIVPNVKASQTSFTYTGATQRPKITVSGYKNDGKVNYKIVYTNSNAPGSYNVQVSLLGGINETSNIAYSIKPRTTTMNVAPVVNGFKVSWSKVAETTGYQIEYSTKSDFSGSALVYGGATNTLSKTITGRAAGTKYYVRVRTYKTLADGTRVWGSWSQAKAVTTNVAQATVKSVSGVTKGFKTTWNKIGGVTGYQIQYSTRKDFKGAATVYAGDKNATAKTITGRAKNTTYYIRVRGYKNNGNGNYVWGAWSAAKTVKTK